MRVLNILVIPLIVSLSFVVSVRLFDDSAEVDDQERRISGIVGTLKGVLYFWGIQSQPDDNGIWTQIMGRRAIPFTDYAFLFGSNAASDWKLNELAPTTTWKTHKYDAQEFLWVFDLDMMDRLATVRHMPNDYRLCYTMSGGLMMSQLGDRGMPPICSWSWSQLDKPHTYRLSLEGIVVPAEKLGQWRLHQGLGLAKSGTTLVSTTTETETRLAWYPTTIKDGSAGFRLATPGEPKKHALRMMWNVDFLSHATGVRISNAFEWRSGNKLRRSVTPERSVFMCWTNGWLQITTLGDLPEDGCFWNLEKSMHIKEYSEGAVYLLTPVAPEGAQTRSLLTPR